jgi:hypothetical protein
MPSKIDYWKSQIKIVQDYMKPRHTMWKELLAAYQLQFTSTTVDPKQIIRKSSMYPIARQVRASIAFNYPRYIATVEDEGYVRPSEILTRAANKAIRLMQVKREVQQQTFDTMFCGISWGKYHFNPAGTNAEPPYVANDELQEDFVAYTRLNPFSVFVDPLCPPHRLGDARFMIERLVVPMEFLMQEERYDKRALGKIKQNQGGTDPFDHDFLADMQEVAGEDQEVDRSVLQRSLDEGQMAELWEISDRIHGDRLTLSMDSDTLLEEAPHPFLKTEPVMEVDGFGNEFQMGHRPTGGYLVQGGFAYSAMRFDTNTEGFFPIPSMEYIKDLEKMQVEGLTRRHDLTKRFPRAVLANQSELNDNPDLATSLKNAEDGAVIGVHDVHAFQEIPWGQPPPDQLNLQAEARQAEDEVLRVSEMSGSSARTATAASFAASAGAVNREWFKQQVADLYVAIARNTLSIFSDARYTPQDFIVRGVADAGGPQETVQVLQQSDFLVNYHITVDAESIQPMAAQRDLDNITALVDRLTPHSDIVDRRYLLELYAQRAGIINTDALFTREGDVVTQKLIDLEHQFLQAGQDPGVLPDEDHISHIQMHTEFMQQLPAPAPSLGSPPQIPAQQMFQQHIQAHQANLGQAAATLGGGTPAASGQLSGGNGIDSQVRSNAQNISNEATNTAREQIG